jgi:hypothetical protein
MIKEIVERIMRTGIIRFAEKAGVPVSQSQLVIFCKDDSGAPHYKSLIQGRRSEDVEFNEILGVKVDLLNRQAIATPFIQQSILRYSAELSIPVSRMYIMVFLDESSQVRLHLYNGSTPIRPIHLQDILAA